MRKKEYYKICIFVLLIIALVFLTGCWDSHELDKLSIIAGLGWDMDPESGEVTLTYQSIIPGMIKNMSSSGGGVDQKDTGSSLQTIQLDHSTGSSTYDVLNRYSQHGSRIPFYQHTQTCIFGKDSAEQGIYPFLDTISRNPASRPNILMVVSEKKASNILETQDGMESIQAIGLAAEINLSQYFSKYPAVTYLEFANRLLSKTTSPIATMVGFIEETGPEGKKVKKILVTGTAVFKGDKLVGKLNERESSGLLWAINKIKKGFLVIEEADMEIIKAKSKITPELIDDRIKIFIEIEEESNLMEYRNKQDLTPDILHQLEKLQAEEIEGQIKAVVEKSFSLNADIFGFGDAVHRKYKKEWKYLEPMWDDIYPKIEVEVKVETHLNEVGDANKALMKE